MRVPAVITTIFLPLTLVAGIYGIIVGMVRAGFGPARPPAQNKRRLEF
ncbi:MAG: hypothetical protein H5U01_02455 [Clostridia bacterium]|nr:hypothetical protein [Clostridia bacterium]